MFSSQKLWPLDHEACHKTVNTTYILNQNPTIYPLSCVQIHFPRTDHNCTTCYSKLHLFPSEAAPSCCAYIVRRVTSSAPSVSPRIPAIPVLLPELCLSCSVQQGYRFVCKFAQILHKFCEAKKETAVLQDITLKTGVTGVCLR
jgi:hypothetical protein